MNIIEKLSTPLSKEDVEIRIGSTSAKGFSLLLYKTARTDVKRLNSVCGTKWKNRHFYDASGLLCCEISVYDDELKEWVSREDVGTESFTEKEKGHYSDSFKRAGFRFGIGIELYNSPFIFVQWEMKPKQSGRGYDAINLWTNNLEITEYDCKNGEPRLTIAYQGRVLFSNFPKKTINEAQVKEITELLTASDADEMGFLQYFNVLSVDELQVEQFDTAKKMLLKKIGGKK